ncbi:hypothetical protein GCM10028805_30490 [Spirosoma harenae]
MQSTTDLFLDWEQSLEPAEIVYLKFHRKRFSYLTEEVIRLATNHGYPDKSVSIMDIGPHFQTTLFRQALGPSVVINTLGWKNVERIVPAGSANEHFTFDLNDSPYQEKWPDCPQHDIVVMAEVFEHLYTAPEYFLGFIRKIMKPGGHLLIGTPNGVCLNQRIGMLMGRNPFEKIRITLNNPGHFREYTTAELSEYAAKTGFEVTNITLSDFYETSPLRNFLKQFRSSLRDCIHIVFKKTDQPDQPVNVIIW